MQQQHRQQGGIIAYIIVGVVLLGLLAGGVYLAKHQARIARSGGEPVTQAPAEQGAEQQADDDRKSDQEAQPQGESEQPAPSDDGAASPDATQPGDNGNGAAPVEGGDGETGVPATGPSSIAATGPEELVATLVAAAVLSGVSIAYVSSRRNLQRAHK